jgi:hypothetical protein
MGGPIAVVALGLANKLLTSGQGAAIIVVALLSVGTCTLGAALLARNPANIASEPEPKAPEEHQPDPHDD